GEARKAILLGDSRGLRLHLRIFRFVRLRAIVDLGDVLVGGHEVLNMLVGELDLLHHLLRSGRAWIKQSKSQKRREQRTQKPPTILNERHICPPSRYIALRNFGHGMTAIARTPM